jgi:LysR family transcriptional regulator, hydrogen peroxide-inducible genes activator
MEMHEIRYFLALCETLNFRRAAVVCHVSQPSLTRAIQKLEEEMEGVLFLRDGKMTELTALGRLLRPELQEILDRSAAALQLARKYRAPDHESLRLGAICTLSPTLTAGLLRGFREQFPGIALSLHDGPPEELTALLMGDEIDLALMAQPKPFGGTLRPRPLFTERFVVACAGDHAFATKQYVTLGDLAGQRFIAQINCEYRRFFANLLKQHKAAPQIVYQTGRSDWLQSLAAAAFGICLLPEHSVTVEGLVVVPLVEPEVSRAISLVTVAGRRHPPIVTKFIRYATTYSWPALGRAPKQASDNAAD